LFIYFIPFERSATTFDIRQTSDKNGCISVYDKKGECASWPRSL